MRIKVNFAVEKELNIPIDYNYLLQSLIYNQLDGKLSNFLHNQGFIANGRSFKLFTFSRILGNTRFIRDKKMLSISSPFSIAISSPVSDFVQSLAENLIRSNEIKINSESLLVESINIISPPQPKSEIEIKMLSPITVYSTLLTADGKKKTYYYTPYESDFSRLIFENLAKKYKAFYRQVANGLKLRIEPLRVSTRSLKIITYKGTVIKGWLGIYKLTGSPELITLAYDTGLGSKNSQGFGCFEVIP
jgi:CRISPR-associated endoribonuclease Cas6